MFAAGAQGWWWAILIPVAAVVVALLTTRYRRRKEARGGYPEDPRADPAHYRDAPVPRVVAPPAWSRAVIAGCGILLVVLAVVTVVADPPVWVVGAVMALVGVVLAVRGGRLGIVLESDRMRVRNTLRTVTIPRASITGIDRLPSIDWTGPDGVSRETLVWALAGGADTAHDPVALLRARAHADIAAWMGASTART